MHSSTPVQLNNKYSAHYRTGNKSDEFYAWLSELRIIWVWIGVSPLETQKNTQYFLSGISLSAKLTWKSHMRINPMSSRFACLACFTQSGIVRITLLKYLHLLPNLLPVNSFSVLFPCAAHMFLFVESGNLAESKSGEWMHIKSSYFHSDSFKKKNKYYTVIIINISSIGNGGCGSNQDRPNK